MKLEELQILAAKDMKISQFDLDDESLKSSILHQKWLDIMTDEILTLKRCEDELKKVYRSKWLYYSGKAEPDEYDRKGDFQLQVQKNDLTMFIESDDEYLKSKSIVDKQREKVAYIESIMKQINNRNWQIRNAIEWRKLTQWQATD